MRRLIVSLILLIIILSIGLFYEFTKKEKESIAESQTTIVICDSVDIKINQTIDSVLKTVSKTDGQIIDMYLEQQETILILKNQINTLEIEIKNLKSLF